MSRSRTRVAAIAVAAVVSAGVLTLTGLPAQAASDQPAGAAVSTLQTRKPNYSLIPATRTTKKGVAKKGLDFGLVTRITEKNGVMKIYFDRAEFYTGRAAAAHTGGEAPPNDYTIVNKSSKLRVFTVAKKASFTGEDMLLDDRSEGVQRTKITREQFLTNFLNAPGPVQVWVRHTKGDKGAVTALGEQYTP